jgi:hypothetical protein
MGSRTPSAPYPIKINMELIFNELSAQDLMLSNQRFRAPIRKKLPHKNNQPNKQKRIARTNRQGFQIKLCNSNIQSREQARQKMELLIETMQEAFQYGVQQTMRTTEEFCSLQLAKDYLVSHWSRDPAVPIEKRLLVLTIATKAPFIAELHLKEETANPLEASHRGKFAAGLGLAYLRKHAVLSLNRRPWNREQIYFKVFLLSGGSLSPTQTQVRNWFEAPSIDRHRDWISEQLQLEIISGQQIIQRQSECLSRLILLAKASEQLRKLTGTEKVFGSIKRHLFALHLHAIRCPQDEVYTLNLQLNHSDESQSRREQLANQLIFACEDRVERPFSFHSKISIDAWRIYFMPTGTGLVRIAYIGEHL